MIINEKSKVKKWYLEKYKNDIEGFYIKNDITFKDIFNALDSYKNIYNIIGAIDSLVRERIFIKLSEIMKVNYNYIYDQWLLGDD